MADFPYVQIWVADFMGDTQHLDCLESGAYLLLLFAAWRSPECGLPDDDRKLARMSRCSLKQWLRIRGVVLGFWTINPQDGRWHQKRLDEVRRKAAIKSIKATQSAQVMWLKRQETWSADAERRQSERNANHSHNQTRYDSSSSDISTDAARGSALNGGSAPRATVPSVKERVTALAVAHRRKLASSA